MSHEIVAALLIRSNRILLDLRSASRAFYPNVWDVFGGHREPGEMTEQTLIRELQEELGITPIEWSFVDTLTTPLQSPPGEPPDSLTVHLYVVTEWEGTPDNRQLEEHSEIGWFSLAQARELHLADALYPELFGRYLSDSEEDSISTA